MPDQVLHLSRRFFASALVSRFVIIDMSEAIGDTPTRTSAMSLISAWKGAYFGSRHTCVGAAVKGGGGAETFGSYS